MGRTKTTKFVNALHAAAATIVGAACSRTVRQKKKKRNVDTELSRTFRTNHHLQLQRAFEQPLSIQTDNIDLVETEAMLQQEYHFKQGKYVNHSNTASQTP